MISRSRINSIASPYQTNGPVTHTYFFRDWLRSERVDGRFAAQGRIVLAGDDLGLRRQLVLDDFGHFGHQTVGEADAHLDRADAIAVGHPDGGAGEPSLGGGVLGPPFLDRGAPHALLVLRTVLGSH